MTNNHDDQEDAPLDPAVERVRVKLARLLFGSIGVMVLGLLAVMFAILYRIGAFGGPETASVDAIAEIPAGAQVVSSSASDDVLTVTVRMSDGAQEIRLFSLPDGEPTGRIRLVSPAN
ncbi:hypothetical protein ACKTEK_11980 [Tepidamorphus sp. 3E244]|uniref:hypothetical protein n=1 Tax=Tepidamorphus sp. 3E244 TaxID=3385498 RepID=UPI0038FC27EE